MTTRYNRSLTGVYNAFLPTLQDGDSSETQVDSHSRLLVAVDVLPTGVSTATLQSEGNLTLTQILAAQNTSTLQLIANASLSSISAKLASPISVIGPITDTQLRASPISVSGTLAISNFPATQPVTGTFFPATQPVSGTVAVSNFPSTQAITGTFFQATQPVSGSVSVSNFPGSQAVTGSFFQATQPVSAATLPLPTGAATSANQSTANTSLASLDTKTPALVSGRQPVDGSGVIQPISTASLPLPAGAATAANQVMNGAAVQANLTVALIAVPLRVGAANQVGRKQLIILANSAGYTYGFSAASQPFALSSAAPLILNTGENITVWAIKASGTNTITVAELN